jgi:gamma-glutamyltranspeptidase/glutathione hydrolase
MSEFQQEIGWHAAGKLGAVAAGGSAAVSAGIDTLRKNGNAIDAGVSCVLALMVTDHGECSFGGEVPLLIYDSSRGEVKALSGMGSAPRSPEAIEWYLRHGIPGAGDIKIAPVPSVVDCCCTALKLYGTISFEQAIDSTLSLLDKGNADWHPRLAVTLRKMVMAERQAVGSREDKIQAACDLFYGRGGDPSIADDLENFYIERGGFLRKADLAAHRTRVEKPATTVYRGYTVYKCGPWTQGPALLQALRLLEGFNLRALGRLSEDTLHIAIESLKLAFADRDAYYGDPEFVQVPLEQLLTEEYTSLRRSLIDMTRASYEVRPGDPYAMHALGPSVGPQPVVGGTTTCVAADRWGNFFAATPSANVMPGRHEGGRAGVTFGNRLVSFNTTPGHPNCIAAGKRPRITLTPTLVLKDAKPVLAISVAGGDLQDQVTLQLLIDHIDFGLSPQQSVCGPRFATLHHQNSFDPNPDRAQAFIQAGSMILNKAVDNAVQIEMARRGHRLDLRDGAIGAPVILWRDESQDHFHAAGDPQAGRHAAAI